MRQADVLVTVTTSKTPVFDGNLLKEGTHVNAIGSFTSDAREVDEITFRRAGKAFVHSEEALAVGDLKVPLEVGAVKSEDIVHLADVIVGKKTGRLSDKDISIFRSVGGAAYDAAVAATTYELARLKHIGTEVAL